MKWIVVILASTVLFSCQKSSDHTNRNDSGTGLAGPESTTAKKTLKINEILEQDLSLRSTMDWGSAESFPLPKENDTEMVKLSYFFQSNKLIKSKDIEKSKGYCEFSTKATANANGSEIAVNSGGKLNRFMEYRSEKTEINNLDYKYDAMFKLTFQSESPSVKSFELACYNVLDFAELEAALDTRFIFTKREPKETK